MNTLVLILFALVLIVLGWAFGDASSSEAFTMADRRARAILVAFGAFTVVGASTFIGVTQFTYIVGAYAGSLGVGAGIGAFSLGYFGGHIHEESNKYKFNTLPDAVAYHYGRLSGSLTTLVSIFTLGSLLVIQVSVASIIIADITSINTYLTSLVLVTIVSFYVYTGGLRAIFITDILQGIGMFILIGGSIIAIYFAELETPNTRLIGEALVEVSQPQVYFIVVLFFTGFLSITGGADVWLRYFSGNSSDSAGRGLYLSASFFIVFLCILTFFGLHVVAQIPDAPPGDAFVQYITKVLPEWLLPFVVMGILSASLSTADAEAHVISTMLVTERAR